MWKITPLMAEWLSSRDNKLWQHSVLNQGSSVVELGCGVSGLVALALAPYIGQYIATDQEYVHRLLKENLESNMVFSAAAKTQPKRGGTRASKIHSNLRKRISTNKESPSPSPSPSRRTRSDNQSSDRDDVHNFQNIVYTSLDWEQDSPSALKQVLKRGEQDSHHSSSHQTIASDDDDNGFDILLACDCVYNNALIQPFVQTCVDICRLRPSYKLSKSDEKADVSHPEHGSTAADKSTICIIAQQLRSPDVFEDWLLQSIEYFYIWRVKDEFLEKGLRSGSGYAVHMLMLREDSSER